MTKHHTPEERRALVQALVESGLSIAKFAASRGLTESSLQRWKAEQGRRAGAASLPRVDFVRLVQTRAAPRGGLVVEVGSARVRVEAGFDVSLLREIVTALGPAP